MVDELGDPPIGDGAAIGGTRAAALISRQGSLPNCGGMSVFAGIRDRFNGNRVRHRPVADAKVTRRDLGDAPILESFGRVRGVRGSPSRAGTAAPPP